MEENPTKVNTDTSPAEVSTRKKIIIYALIVSVPITSGLVALVLADTTLGLGVMWLVAGLILLPLITYKWNWFKKYVWGARDNVKASRERSARIHYSILTALWTVFGTVFTVLGAISP